MQLNKNTTLLTGATCGIGLELLRQFYRLGNNVIATSSSEKKLADLKNRFTNISTIVCDLSDA